MTIGRQERLERLRKNAATPRVMKPSARGVKPATDETLDEAVLRYQQAKADTEALDAERRALDVAKARGELIPAADARDALEASHLAWVAELEQLPHAVANAMPPEVPSSIREHVRAAVEAGCLAIRRRIGGAE